MKPRITQAKHGRWTADGSQRFRNRNWILDLGETRLVYDTFETAVLGLRTFGTEYRVSPLGLRNFQWMGAQ